MGFFTIWDNNNKNTGEDERLALSSRFVTEGLDVRVLNDSQKLAHVWQWLVDAESNCLSLRRQIDKLHRQHEQDLKEVEEYLEHVWKLSNDRLKQLESENKSLKKLNNESKRSPINSLLKQNDNLCDSLKLKSNSKQISVITIGDKIRNNDLINNSSNNNKINSFNNDSKVSKSPKTMRRNTITNIDSDNNYLNCIQHSEQLQALQEMCQQFKKIINQLEDKIINLEKSNRNLEIENETLSYKLSESQSQSDQLEHQLLKLSDKRQSRILGSNQDLLQPTVKTVNTGSEDDPTLNLLLASRLSNASQSDVNLVKQIQDLKSDKHRLEGELQKRWQELKELAQKYDKRKMRHKEMLVRLRTHIERENRQLEQLLQSTDHKYKLAEEELLKHKKYCRISDITAINEVN